MSDLQEAFFKITALEELLEREFELLKAQEFAEFEALQERKNQLLEFIASHQQLDQEGIESNNINAEAILNNEELSERLQRCRDRQQRNEILVRQKLSSIREALKTLKTGGDQRSNTYEHLGKGRR
jgi:flagellar biosynthesis/type III secretory pathway chaperone